MSVFSPVLLSNHKPQINAFRLFALIMIVQLHVWGNINELASDKNQLLLLFSLSFWFGMDGFFIISGYLIGSLLLFGNSLSSFRGFLRFYVRRSLRIFPLYYVVLVLSITLGLMAGFAAIHPETWKEFAFLTNYPFNTRHVLQHSWSLSVEEHFYLTAPLLLTLLLKLPWKRLRIGIFFAVWIAGALTRVLIAMTVEKPYGDAYEVLIFTPTHCRIDILISGVFLAYLERFHLDDLRRLYAKAWFRRSLFVCALVSFMMLLRPHAYQIENLVVEALMPGFISSLFYFPLLLWSFLTESRIKNFLALPGFRLFSTFAYGVYLIHFPLIFWLLPFFMELRGLFSPLAMYIFSNFVVITLSFVLAYILHLIVEKPFMLLRARFVP